MLLMFPYRLLPSMCIRIHTVSNVEEEEGGIRMLHDAPAVFDTVTAVVITTTTTIIPTTSFTTILKFVLVERLSNYIHYMNYCDIILIRFYPPLSSSSSSSSSSSLLLVVVR